MDIPTLDERRELLRLAAEATRRSYAPYSNFHVGAAVLTETGSYYAGCNVENVSYGLTVCAERVAIFTAVAAEGPGTRVRAIAVQCDRDVTCSPCGACRQVVSELGPDAIVLYPENGQITQTTSSAMLPAAFVTFDSDRPVAGIE